MLKYSKGQKISINLTLINNDGSPESNATVNYEIYDDTDTLHLSGNSVTYNSQLGSYIDIIDPSSEWPNQEEGVYYIKWEISNTTEDYPNVATEEMYIESYDDKLDRLLGLSHENTFIDQAVYDQYGNLETARLRIYSDPDSVGTDANVIAEYEIPANTTDIGRFDTWQQKRTS